MCEHDNKDVLRGVVYCLDCGEPLPGLERSDLDPEVP